MPTKIKLTCVNCGKIFYVNKGREKQTCSNKCRWELKKKKDQIYFETKKCLNCGNLFISKIKENKKFCSYKCAGEARHLIAIETRNCLVCNESFEERKKHKRNFCSEKCRFVWQNKPENIEKRIKKSKDTIKNKYGEDSIFKIKSYQKQIQNKNKEKNKINIKHAQKKINEKRNKTLYNRFLNIGYEIIEFKKDNIVVKHPDGHIFENKRKLIVNRLNHNVELSTTLLPISAPKSTLELKLCDFLKDLNLKYKTNDRNLLKNNEIDILIDNIGIEINGLYWHSEYYVDKYYHVRKLELCEEKNIKLLNFFEDEIIEKFDIIKSMIKANLNLTENIIYARKCEIRKVLNKEALSFLSQNHIQGPINSLFKFGLYYNNELVSLMTFGKKRKILGNINKDGEFELLRFCNKLNHSVVGGASKLLKHFINEIEPIKIITYANRRYSNGNLYKQLNFTEINKTPPSYWYVINKERKHRFKYRKNILIEEGFDSNKTEHEIMLERKIPRIYDCGNIKYELII